MMHNVAVSYKHKIVCDVCGPLYDASSAGEAEEYASHHINEDIGDEDPRPHYSHIITISPITVVESI